MLGWLEICEGTKKKLDRDLQQQEIDFLKWLYEEYRKENECEFNRSRIST